MGRLLLIALASLVTLLASAGAGFAQDINPYTGRPYSKAAQEYRDRLKAEEEAAERGNEEARQADEALRREKAADIAADEARVRQWLKDHPSPPGASEVFVASSYGEGYVLEQTRIVYFNKLDDPTHEVELGPDGKATGPVRQTQQGKAWETIGPHVPEGGYPRRSYGKDQMGEEIITGVEITAPGGRVVARYDFNDEGVPWRGETFDPETGQRTGGFQDERLKSPPPTKGEPLTAPPTLRLITGVCAECRPAADRHNELAAEINRIIADMQSQSAQHQATDVGPAKASIRQRHAVLQGQLNALMPRYEAARAEALACKCPPPAEPPKPATALTGAEPESILDDLDDPLFNPEPPRESILDDIEDPPPPKPSAAEPPVLPTAMAYPADDSDLEQVLARAEAYLAAANCEGMECPKVDCVEARKALQALIDMEAYLKHMVFYAERADADHLAHFKSLADANILNGQQRDLLIRVIALQEFYHNFGSMLLDIASVSSWLKDVASGEKALKDMSPTEMVDQLNSLYQAAKDFESGVTTVAGSLSGQKVPTPLGDAVDVAGGVDAGTINDTTATITDLKSIAVDGLKIMEEAKKNGTDWREGFKKSGILSAAGQIAGRYLKGWSARNLAERQQRLNDLLSEADAGDIVQAESYRALQRAQRRRWAAVDALAAVQQAKGPYMDCVTRACGPMSIAGPVIPEFEKAVPGTDTTRYSWGEALRYLNGAVAQTLPKMNPVAFRDECPPKDEDQTYADPGAPPLGVIGQPTASLPPGAVRPQFERVNLTLPASFCSEFERNDFLTKVYNPAAAAALANANTAQGYQTRLNGLFTEYMRNEGGPVWAAIRKEIAEFEPIAGAAQAEAERLRTLYQDILAIPLRDCPQAAEDTTVPSAGQPLVPVADPKPKPGKPDCPPEDRRAQRQPISVGPNGKVGSGARLKAKAASTALGIAGGLLGGGGGSPLGGGGGGGGGPQTVICKIKDSEMTVFTDPATGVGLRVGAKRAGGTLVVFADIAKSPDNGTFQAAFMENAAGETLAPADVGICELWGEWKLTVSWTRSTYVDGQLVSRESGGWSKSGLFSIPGVLSTVQKPDGLWKRLGFSNASHGARKIAMQYRLPPGGGPLDTIIHVTRPGEDPVTTVPFAIRLVEGPNGITVSQAPEVKDDCPPESPRTQVRQAEPPPTASSPPPPSPPAAPPSQPLTSTPPSSGTTTRPKKDPVPTENLMELERLIDIEKNRDIETGEAMERLRGACLSPQDQDGWLELRDMWASLVRQRLDSLEAMVPTGPLADGVREAINAEKARSEEVLRRVRAMGLKSCPAPDAPQPGEPPAGSILDEIEEVLVPA